jgi:IS5 family transposase
VDADSGLVHKVVGTATNVNDVTQAGALVHGEEADVFADAGYQGVATREETQGIKANWHVAMRPGKRKALDKATPMGAVLDKLEHLKASIRAKVEHPFRVIKRQFGHRKVRYRGLAKNTSQLLVMFALSNLWMVRKSAPAAGAKARKQAQSGQECGKLAANSVLVSPCEHSRINSRFGGGFADHP